MIATEYRTQADGSPCTGPLLDFLECWKSQDNTQADSQVEIFPFELDPSLATLSILPNSDNSEVIDTQNKMMQTVEI